MADGEWEHPPVVVALEAQVEFCPSYELCNEVEWSPETSRMMKGWDQDVEH